MGEVNEMEKNEAVMVPAILTETSVFLLLPDGCVARIVDPEVEVATPEMLVDTMLTLLGEEAAEEAQAYVNSMGGK
jgi:hypothetical protein